MILNTYKSERFVNKLDWACDAGLCFVSLVFQNRSVFFFVRLRFECKHVITFLSSLIVH